MFSGAAVAGVSLVVLASALLDASSAGAVSSALTITSMPGTVIEVAIAVTPAIVAPVLNFLLFLFFFSSCKASRIHSFLVFCMVSHFQFFKYSTSIITYFTLLMIDINKL